MNLFLKMLTASVLVFAATVASAATPVKLLRAQSYVIHFPTYTEQVPTVDAVVETLGSGQQVSVHLQTYSGAWVDVGMVYNRPAGTGYQVWTANLSSFLPYMGASPYALTFALKYVVNGQTYWDNNGGSNYTIAADSGSYLPTANVYDGSYHASVAVVCSSGAVNNVINGNITVRNIAYAKNINVVYSTDNWATQHSVAATFSSTYWLTAPSPVVTQVTDESDAANPNQYGFEEWNYSLDIGTATSVQYAVSYTVNGQTYWDNNFLQNYSVTLNTCS